MFGKKRIRPTIVLAIIGLLFVVPLATACSDELLVFFSTDSAGTVDGVEYTKDDIIVFNGSEWAMAFDGSEHGLDPSKHDIEAFSVPITETLISETFDVYMSFYQNKVMVPGLGQVKGQEAIKFSHAVGPSDSYTYTRYFDGTDVGLTTVSEKIDGLEVLDEEVAQEITGGDCVGLISISTFGEFSIPAKYSVEGKLTGDGSDLLVFCATNTGAETAGFWLGFFDGTEEGMPKNYLDSIALFFEAFFFTTPGAFNVDAAFGGHSEIYFWAGDFEGPVFSAPDEGLTSFVDGVSMMFVEEGGFTFPPFGPDGINSLEELNQRLEATYPNWHSAMGSDQ